VTEDALNTPLRDVAGRTFLRICLRYGFGIFSSGRNLSRPRLLLGGLRYAVQIVARRLTRLLHAANFLQLTDLGVYPSEERNLLMRGKLTIGIYDCAKQFRETCRKCLSLLQCTWRAPDSDGFAAAAQERYIT